MSSALNQGTTLHWGDIVVIVGYFVVSIGVGIWVSLSWRFRFKNESFVDWRLRTKHEKMGMSTFFADHVQIEQEQR